MLTKKYIREYYKTAELVLLPHSQFRQYKFRLLNGRWKILTKKIRDVEQLREQLIKYAPIDAYQSVSLWLNPTKIEFKNQSSMTDKLFLSSTGFLDFDDTDLKQARQDAYLAIEYLKRWGYGCLRCVFSGCKGYHVYFSLTRGYTNIKHPNERIRYYQTLKNKVVDKLQNLNLPSLDVNTSKDIFRISRIIGSLHHNGGVCQKIKI